MKKTGSLIFFILLNSCFFSQNLVPNPSFESYTSCPDGSAQIYKAVPWFGSGGNNEEYFNTCGSGVVNVPFTANGFKNARTGGGFAGEWWYKDFNGYREYICVQLTSTLVADECYLVRYYVSRPNYPYQYSCNNFGAHLSSSVVATGSVNPLGINSHIYRFGNPIISDTLKWVEIGGVYKASGGEKYITIGNFKVNSQTDTVTTSPDGFLGIYYFIDDVSVEQITAPTWQMKDTMITLGDSVLIGPLYSGLTCVWKDILGNPIGTGSGLYVKPIVNTKYILEQTFCGNTFFDTVEVKIKTDIGINEYFQNSKNSRIYPNPSKSEFKVQFTDNVQRQQAEISIFDITGRLMFKTIRLLNETEMNMSNDLLNGTYLLKVKFEDGTFDVHRLIITK